MCPGAPPTARPAVSRVSPRAQPSLPSAAWYDLCRSWQPPEARLTLHLPRGSAHQPGRVLHNQVHPHREVRSCGTLGMECSARAHLLSASEIPILIQHTHTCWHACIRTHEHSCRVWRHAAIVKALRKQEDHCKPEGNLSYRNQSRPPRTLLPSPARPSLLLLGEWEGRSVWVLPQEGVSLWAKGAALDLYVCHVARGPAGRARQNDTVVANHQQPSCPSPLHPLLFPVSCWS